MDTSIFLARGDLRVVVSFRIGCGGDSKNLAWTKLDADLALFTPFWNDEDFTARDDDLLYINRCSRENSHGSSQRVSMNPLSRQNDQGAS
jgi:hypothetical protein